MTKRKTALRPVKARPCPWRDIKRRILVVLPAYNEAENLGSLLEKIDEAMWEDKCDYVTIVVDDGSKDETPEVVQRYAEFLPVHYLRHETNLGLGATIRDGLKYAAEICTDHDVIVAMDADNSHTPTLIRSMVRGIREGNDVVIASRYQYGAYVRGVPAHRLLLSHCARFVATIMFPIHGVRDYTCGFRAYRGGLLKAAFEKFGNEFVKRDGFEAMLDILLNLRKMDAIIREVPLILRYDQKKGVSKLKIFRTIRRSLGLLFQRRFLS